MQFRHSTSVSDELFVSVKSDQTSNSFSYARCCTSRFHIYAAKVSHYTGSMCRVIFCFMDEIYGPSIRSTKAIPIPIGASIWRSYCIVLYCTVVASSLYMDRGGRISNSENIAVSSGSAIAFSTPSPVLYNRDNHSQTSPGQAFCFPNIEPRISRLQSGRKYSSGHGALMWLFHGLSWQLVLTPSNIHLSTMSRTVHDTCIL